MRTLEPMIWRYPVTLAWLVVLAYLGAVACLAGR